MADEPKCSRCGKPVPSTALGGMCPECLLGAGFATHTEGSEETRAVPPQPSEIAALFPQLEILECLGRGGMGVVYKARQPRLNRLVALKILARERQQDGKFTDRFTREAQALARLNHPNIVTVYDFGEAGGHCYLLMEFVDGLSLRHLLQSAKMPTDQALTIVPEICKALQYAHEQGIVHRDIKPENILLDKQGRVKIADFGIAKMVGVGAGQQQMLTGAKDVVGTPHYMAPEQIEKPMEVDHRADIYSLGVVFYEMLTGELPLGKFAAPSKRVQVDVRLDTVVLRALEKEPSLRYQQASQLKTQVETISGRGDASAPPVEVPALAVAVQRPDRFWRGFATAVIALIAITFVVVFITVVVAVLENVFQSRHQPESFSVNVTHETPRQSLPKSLIAHWAGDGDARDAKGTSNGILVGNVRFSPGIHGTAFRFSGNGATVQIPRSASLDPGNELTIEFWMKEDSDSSLYSGLVTSDFYGIGFASYGGTKGINFSISTTADRSPNADGTTTATNFTHISDGNGIGAPLTPNRWHHIAGTYDGRQLQLYVDGRPWGSPVAHRGRIRPMLAKSFVTIGSEDGRTTCPVCIGQQYFKGLIDEVNIHNRALSAFDINVIYQIGITQAGVPPDRVLE